MNDNTKNIINNLSQLKWACRRGMLELDVLLGNFLEHAYTALSMEDKHLFTNLLECSDPTLFAWLLGHEIPTDPRFNHLIQVIRQHAQKQFSVKTL